MNQSKLLTARTMTCSHCSAGIDQADVFCRKCGASQVQASRFNSVLENPLLKAELVLLVALGTFLVSGAIWCVKKPAEQPKLSAIKTGDAKYSAGGQSGQHHLAPNVLISQAAAVAALDPEAAPTTELSEIQRLLAQSRAISRGAIQINSDAGKAILAEAAAAMKTSHLRKIRNQVRIDIAAERASAEAIKPVEPVKPAAKDVAAVDQSVQPPAKLTASIGGKKLDANSLLKEIGGKSGAAALLKNIGAKNGVNIQFGNAPVAKDVSNAAPAKFTELQKHSDSSSIDAPKSKTSESDALTFSERTSRKVEPGRRPSQFVIDTGDVSEETSAPTRKKSASDVSEYNHALAEFLQHQTHNLSDTADGAGSKEPPSYEEWLKSGKAKF